VLSRCSLAPPGGCPRRLPSFPPRRSSDLECCRQRQAQRRQCIGQVGGCGEAAHGIAGAVAQLVTPGQREIAQLDLASVIQRAGRSEEHTSELQSRFDLVCRLLLEKNKKAK